MKRSMIFMILSLFLSCASSSYFDDEKLLTWMSQTSGIYIPNTINYNQTEAFYDMEWGKIIKFQLQEEEFKTFIQENNLINYSKDSKVPILLMDIENIDFSENYVVKEEDYLYLYDCKTGFHWRILANKEHRTVWFEIIYADYGRDVPPCEK